MASTSNDTDGTLEVTITLTRAASRRFLAAQLASAPDNNIQDQVSNEPEASLPQRSYARLTNLNIFII